jgi:hypothetical protein
MDEKKYPDMIKDIAKTDPSIYASYDILIIKYLRSLELLNKLHKDMTTLMDTANEIAFHVPEQYILKFSQHYATIKGMKYEIEDNIKEINQ